MKFTNMSSKVDLSCVILSYNRKETLRETLKELLLYPLDFEIIVVDNGSNDGTPEMIKKEFPDIKLISLSKNIGVSAYNKGFFTAKGKYILVLDDDSFPLEGTVEKMIEEFEKDPEIGAVALDVRNYYFYKNKKDKKVDSEKNSNYLIGFNGAGVGLRKSLIESIGGYPDEFFLYFNELDLSIRILNEGYKIVWLPGAIVLHKSDEKNRTSERAPFFYTRNLFFIAIKYFPLKMLIPFIIKLSILTIYHSLEQKTPVYIRALFDSFKKSKIAVEKRIKVKESVISNLKITEKLAFTYFEK